MIWGVRETSSEVVINLYQETHAISHLELSVSRLACNVY